METPIITRSAWNNAFAACLEHNVAGEAIMTSEMDPELVRMLSKRKIPIVFLDTGKAGPLTSNISIDYQHGIDLAIDHLTAF